MGGQEIYSQLSLLPMLSLKDLATGFETIQKLVPRYRVQVLLIYLPVHLTIFAVHLMIFAVHLMIFAVHLMIFAVHFMSGSCKVIKALHPAIALEIESFKFKLRPLLLYYCLSF